jgi:formylglycine-generating enzyme required for sulfatase activity
MPENHPKISVFLCHASPDKPLVRELYQRLCAEDWVDPWLDEEKLLPGQDWDIEIEKAVEDSGAVMVCLSGNSVTKEGYVQKELRFVLNIAYEKPEGSIFIIPVRLDDCDVPRRLGSWHYVDYFPSDAQKNRAFQKILDSLKACHGKKPPAPVVTLDPDISGHVETHPPQARPAHAGPPEQARMQPAEQTPGLAGEQERLLKIARDASLKPGQRAEAADALDALGWQPDDLNQFVHIPAGKDHAAFWIGKYPVTNAQYERFLQAEDFENKRLWRGFPKFDQACQKMDGDWAGEGWKWFMANAKVDEMSGRRLIQPRDWQDKRFGINRRCVPVVGISWYEANAYCCWLKEHWEDEELGFSSANPDLHPRQIRLPLEREWEGAAGGKEPERRFPWDLNGKATEKVEDILQRANVEESRIGRTTPVWMYPLGASPAGVWDMAGNVWEWQANFWDKENNLLALGGGSWYDIERLARMSFRGYDPPEHWSDYNGFRVVVPS